ncbi:IS5 family transposase [Streptomyces sp. NPDC091281]|uniref:IS5 family transposase n=1 Tax=Streptomyces sp. NPDC091281 TaxID=3365985 RepID=UPI0038008A93
MGRGDLTGEEGARLKPHLPKSGRRGGRWCSHRRIINGILYINRTGVPWRDLPARSGKWKTVYERHRRWSADGTWDRLFTAVLADADAEGRIDWSMVSVDPTSCRAHQHAAGARKKPPRLPGKGACPKQHRLAILAETSGDKAYSSRRNRRYLRRRQIKHTIPEPKNQPADRQARGSGGGRPPGFDKRAYLSHGTVTLASIRLWPRP